MESALIAGGGDYIAFTVGRLKALKKNYDIVIGTSAGALIAPLVALGYISRAEAVISTISPDKIFNVNPFNKKGNVKILNAIWRLSIGKRTIGENSNLPNLIKQYYTIDDHRALLISGKKVYITACNTNRADYPAEIICLNNCNYNDAVNYMWASASVPVVCSLVKIGNYEYADGGITLNVPIDFLTQMGIKDIDVFIHDTEPENEIKPPVKNIFNLMGRILNWQRQKVQFDELINIDKSVTTNIYWLPYNPADKCLLFNRDVMAKYANAGYLQVINKRDNLYK